MSNKKDEIDEAFNDDVPEAESEVPEQKEKSTIEQIQDMQEKKANQKKTKKTIVESATKTPVKPKPKKPKTFDVEKINIFKDKLIKDFGLEEKTNERKRTALKLNGKTVIRFIPRKRVWYAVKHKEPSMNNRIQYYTVTSEQEEQEHYDFVKGIVESQNKEEAK